MVMNHINQLGFTGLVSLTAGLPAVRSMLGGKSRTQRMCPKWVHNTKKFTSSCRALGRLECPQCPTPSVLGVTAKSSWTRCEGCPHGGVLCSSSVLSPIVPTRWCQMASPKWRPSQPFGQATWGWGMEDGGQNPAPMRQKFFLLIFVIIERESILSNS